MLGYYNIGRYKYFTCDKYLDLVTGCACCAHAMSEWNRYIESNPKSIGGIDPVRETCC